MHATARGTDERATRRSGGAPPTAVAEVERRGGHLADHRLPRAFLTHRLAPHEELLDLLVERGGGDDFAEALRLSDAVKARTLMDLLSSTVGARTRPVGAGHAGAGEHEPGLALLRSDLDATYGELLAAAEPDRTAVLRRRADELEQQISALLLRTPAGAHPVAPERPAGGVAGRARVLSYHVLDDDVMVFVVRGGRTHGRRLPGVMPAVRVELDRLAAQWSRFQMGDAFTRRAAHALRDTALTILRDLYDLLLRPVADDLDGPLGADLTIVPHGRLTEVPFHALFDGEQHLLARWTVTLCPVVPESMWSRSPGASPTALVMAVPDAVAPSVAAEAAAVGRHLVDAVVLVGEQATSGALVEHTPAAGLVHLACHGLYRPGNPLFSSLRLADRWLTAAEILELDLRGKLVVLSACESGRQGGATAEPVGLAWAFLAAGARGLVVSQWVVHDQVTSRLMAEFHRHLAAGDSPAGALRAAQLAAAVGDPHPFYWAPFAFVAAPATSSLDKERS